MLDENLPAFFLKPSTQGIKHHNEFYLSHHGSEPEPAYHLEHADPNATLPAHKNCYALALFDAWNPAVLYGEVIARPEWSKSSAHADAPGGIPPPPQPNLPSEFVVQLYNPEQQVKVEVKSSTFGQDSYEFSLPQDVFRTPSASSLDRGTSDPASLEVTPRITFVWRKDGRLNKDLTCFMTGKSTDKKKKSSRKDPDISIALWRQMRELTIYEPNLSRIELEDPKGLECVLLLTAVAIKELYFGPSKEQMRELFNLSSDAAAADPRKLSAGGRKLEAPGAPDAHAAKSNSLPKLQTAPGAVPNARPSSSQNPPPPPFPDARAQWEQDAETARLKAQVEQEKAEARRRRQEQDKKDEAERRRLQKMVEQEERAARMKQAEVDKETERLRKLYGVEPIAQFQPQQPPPPPQQQQPHRPTGRPQKAKVGSNGLYVQSSASASNVGMMSGANGSGSGALQPPAQSGVRKKTSFWR